MLLSGAVVCGPPAEAAPLPGACQLQEGGGSIWRQGEPRSVSENWAAVATTQCELPAQKAGHVASWPGLHHQEANPLGSARTEVQTCRRSTVSDMQLLCFFMEHVVHTRC